jgi:tRNA threonylcarbamoyladenosine biosynthesis protein TsaB
MTLFIDTTNFETTTFVLRNQKVLKQKLKILPYESFNVTKKLEEFLKKNKVSYKTINKIVVSKGPGSYTGVRVGLSLSQALSLAWDKPLVVLENTKFITELNKKNPSK